MRAYLVKARALSPDSVRAFTRCAGQDPMSGKFLSGGVMDGAWIWVAGLWRGLTELLAQPPTSNLLIWMGVVSVAFVLLGFIGAGAEWGVRRRRALQVLVVLGLVAGIGILL